jgi:fructosamine-3-kinase
MSPGAAEAPPSSEAAVRQAVATATGMTARRVAPLSGGCVAEAYRVELADGTTVAVKRDPAGRLAVEGFMLDYLRRHADLPVPAVIHCDDTLLVMDYVATAGRIDSAVERHAAALVAGLHGVTAPRFGFVRDTAIGGLHQPNPEGDSWVRFFRDHRLLAMGRRAHAAGHLTCATLLRLEKFCARLERFIAEPPAPALLHGDLWGGNVLVRDGRVAAFIDPALYYGDPEVDLAFATLFSTFGAVFFERYAELRPIAPGFFEARRDIYNLYPLLVHTTLFGGHYGNAVHRIVARFV